MFFLSGTLVIHRSKFSKLCAYILFLCRVHLRKPRVLTPLRLVRKEQSGVSTFGLRRCVV